MTNLALTPEINLNVFYDKPEIIWYVYGRSKIVADFSMVCRYFVVDQYYWK